MSPTVEELELGAKAYHQVRFYENYAVRNMRQTPWVFAGSITALIVLDMVLKTHQGRDENFVFVFIMIAALVGSWVQNRMTKDRYADQKLILQLLEEKYGEALPWVMEEKQLARACALEAAIAQDQQHAHQA
jgi:hypothetical protein